MRRLGVAIVLCCITAAGDSHAQSPSPPKVAIAGSTGLDASVNAAPVPLPGYTLIATLPVNPARNSWFVQNQSTDLIAEVRDDGTGANQTTIMLAGANVAGAMGGADSEPAFRGRVRIYVPTANATIDQIALAQY